jgi:putative ABC transport system permease protein
MRFELRDVLRGLRRDVSYSATVVLTLALTIGATTAVFSIVNGVLLKPLAYSESDRLVGIQETWRELVRQSPTLEVNERHAEYWRQHASSFEAIAQFTIRPANLTAPGEAVQCSIGRTNGSLFTVLRVQAALGRVLLPQDERQGAEDVAVISDALWRRRFGADPAVVGRSIGIDGHPHTVVGVLSPAFLLPQVGRLTRDVDAFVPLHSSSDWIGVPGWVGDHNNEAIGRLRGGVDIDRARTDIELLQQQVSAIATAEAHETVTLGAVVMPLTESVAGRSRQGLLVLLASVLAVLLIACTNLANLSLSRTIGRLRETAIRSALGAGRYRLVIRVTMEQTLLAAAGGILGVWIAAIALRVFVRTAAVDLPRAVDVALDGRVLAAALILSACAGLAVAVLPAWRIAVQDVESALRAASAAIAAERGGLRVRAVLLALQIALSVTLLVVTALLTVSFVRLMKVDRGFRTERVLAVDVSLPAARYVEAAPRLAIYDRVLTAVQALPGVEHATTTSMLPLSGQGQVNFIVAEGRAVPRSEQPTANFRFVAPEFTQTLGLPLRRGRLFAAGERDHNRPAPALISESTAARLWPNQDPIGKRFSRGVEREQGFEVVGVVGNARLTSLERTPPYMVYLPYWWRSYPAVSLLIRTGADPSSIVPSIRTAIRQIDPEIAVGDGRSLERLVDDALAGRRYQTRLFLAFGAVGLAIAIIGVYAVTAYGVSRRRREMNIRAALGARPRQVLGMILRQTGRTIAVGLASGLFGAVAAGRVMASLLFAVGAKDPLVLTGVSLLVGLTGLGAAAIAARGSLSLNPAAALRDE